MGRVPKRIRDSIPGRTPRSIGETGCGSRFRASAFKAGVAWRSGGPGWVPSPGRRNDPMGSSKYGVCRPCYQEGKSNGPGASQRAACSSAWTNRGLGVARRRRKGKMGRPSNSGRNQLKGGNPTADIERRLVRGNRIVRDPQLCSLQVVAGKALIRRASSTRIRAWFGPAAPPRPDPAPWAQPIVD